MENIIHSARSEMRYTHRNQEKLYRKYVDNGYEGYQEYIKHLNGFHASSFDKVINKILEEDSKVINQFARSFQHIPDYIAKRSVWDKKRKDILQGDGPSHAKQQALDSLDQSRTASHNGVIDLFNKLNQYAEEKKIANPYPIEYHYFDKGNKNHRSDVAKILTRHTTLIENINEFTHIK